MKILLYDNRKIEPKAWIADGEHEEAALLSLFNYLDEEWEVYGDIEAGRELSLYASAKSGNAGAAKELLTCRRRNECEGWKIIDAV